jgi:hypothetical protein
MNTVTETTIVADPRTRLRLEEKGNIYIHDKRRQQMIREPTKLFGRYTKVRNVNNWPRRWIGII